ncbi:MAG: hypothetical protein AAB368_09105, partial [bacterium]
MKDVALFLGSGATAGSGIKHVGHCLPSDRGFFKSDLVEQLLESGHYPALKHVRTHFPRYCRCGLSETWNTFYLARSFGRAAVLNESPPLLAPRDFLKVLKTESAADASQRRHYQIQRQDYERGYGTIEAVNPQWSQEKLLDELFGLAIWDLRILVCRVYGLAPSDPEEYESLWKAVSDRVAGVVNLNYDTTFEDSMASKLEGIRVFKPHGSLKWLKWNRRLLGQQWCMGAPWPTKRMTEVRGDYGYRNGSAELVEFIEPNIVSPDNYKEVLVGGSNSMGIIDPLLRDSWLCMDRFLRKADHFLFLGFSLSSADSHLAFLISNALSLKSDQGKQTRVHVTYQAEKSESKDPAK